MNAAGRPLNARRVDVVVGRAAWIVAALVVPTTVMIARTIRPDADRMWLVGWSVLAALGVFASLALHEIARTVALRASGVEVRSVTVMGFAEDEGVAPRAEARAALAAPLASVVAGAGLLLHARARGVFTGEEASLLDVLGVASGFAALEVVLGLVNVAVAAVNLLPALPLDGGRLARAALAAVTGDPLRATRWTTWSAQVIGFGAILVGVWIVLAQRGALAVVGVWAAFFGWCLSSAAARTYEHALASRGVTE